MAGNRAQSRLGWLLLAVGGLIAVGQGAAAGGQAWVDPTRPPDAVQRAAADGGGEGGPAPELQSILIGDGRRLALIGGRSYRVGDSLGSLTVQNIFRDRVVLQGAGGTRILRLSTSSGMRKAPSP